MTEQSAEQLLRQTLADTLASVRTGNNPAHAIPSGGDLVGDEQGDKIPFEGDDAHPKLEAATDAKSLRDANFDVNGAPDPKDDTGDGVESHAVTVGIAQSTADTRTNPNVAENTEAFALPAGEMKPEKGKRETEPLTDTRIDRQKFCCCDSMHVVCTCAEPEAVHATMAVDSTAPSSKGDPEETEKNKTPHYEPEDKMNDLGPIAQPETQPDSHPDPKLQPEPEPEPEPTFISPTEPTPSHQPESKPHLIPDLSPDAITSAHTSDLNPEPDPEPEMESFSDSRANSKPDSVSKLSATRISVPTPDSDINATAEPDSEPSQHSDPNADTIEDANPDTDTDSISNANVDSAEMNTDLKPNLILDPNISDMHANLTTDTSADDGSSVGSRQAPKRRRSMSSSKTPRKPAKPPVKGTNSDTPHAC